jgi:uncharacterized membrane protein
MAGFSIRQAYKQAFNLTIDNISSLLPAFAFVAVAYALNACFAKVAISSGPLFRLVFICVSAAVALLFTIGLERIGLDLTDRGSTKWERLFSGFNIIGLFFLSGLFYGLIVIGGCLLLIIPGIIWSIKYSLHDLFIVDTQCTAQESITRSGQLTEGHKGKLFWFYVLNWFIGALSFGLLYPVILFARISVYRQLQRKLFADAKFAKDSFHAGLGD